MGRWLGGKKAGRKLRNKTEKDSEQGWIRDHPRLEAPERMGGIPPWSLPWIKGGDQGGPRGQGILNSVARKGKEAA